ncbi:MAG: RDD family protein [Acidimicrobiia bacterium]|nr:RDD family protein [Acidimicrobiia bacterium]
MRTRDRLTVTTPEDVDVTMPLAGIGSRAMAAIIDLLVQLLIMYVAMIAIGMIAGAAGAGVAGAVLGALMIAVAFAVLFGYNFVTELWFRGRSPGKRALNIAVEREDGLPIDLSASARRNLLRIVDFLPLFYCVGLVCIVLTGRRKRLGDLVAGTVVLQDERPAPGTGFLVLTPRPVPDWAGWDVSGITEDDLLLIRRYLHRRPTLTPAARHDLRERLAARARSRTMGVPEQDADLLLEGIVLAKSQQAFMRQAQLVGAWPPPPVAVPAAPGWPVRV